MDFAKYVALLQDQALYFPRLDCFEDAYEGTLTKIEFERVQREKRDDVLRQARIARKTIFVNCWHLGNTESEAMWKLYSVSSYAIAVQSSYNTLGECLPQVHTGCFIGAVQYINHHADSFPSDNIFYPPMHKRLSLAHEHEIRAVVWRRDPGTEHPDALEGYPMGIPVRIALDQLVHRVVISPTAPEWFVNVVADVTNKYGFHFSVVQSELKLLPYL